MLHFVIDQYGSVESVRTVRVCTLWLRFVVGCALLFLCSSVDKWRMMVPFGGTDLMEETVSRIKTKLGQYYLSGYRCIQQSTTNLIRLLFGNFRRVYFWLLIRQFLDEDETGTLYLFQKDRIRIGTVRVGVQYSVGNSMYVLFDSYEVF